MPDISISVSYVTGLDWPRWQQLAAEVDALGFAGLYRFDHFAAPFETDDPESLDLTVSLAYLATQTHRIRFGPLVAPLTFRDPHLLARQAAAIDDLSGGRMILGVGAGWLEREHTMYGYPFGDLATRMARFEEGLNVLTRLLRSPDPVTYEGRYFQLRGAHLRPRPQRPGGPPILIGGKGGKRNLALVARYADIWNIDQVPAETARESSAMLDRLLLEAGRQPQDVKRTAHVRVLCWQNMAELEARISGLRPGAPFGPDLPADEFVTMLQKLFSGLIVGPPEYVVARLQDYIDAGIEELMISWTVSGDIDGLRALAEYILPHFAPKNGN